MATKIFAAFVAAMMTMTMSANTVNGIETSPEPTPGTNAVVVKTQDPMKKVLVVTDDTNTERKYEYNLDDQNRVVNRISYVKGVSGKWMPAAAYMVVYTNDEAVLTYAEYSQSNKTFTSKPQQMRYNKSEYPEVLRLPEMLK